MNLKRWRWVFALEAACCAAMNLLPQQEAGLLQLFSFPFAQLGLALRALSLSGAAGNAAAIALYVLVCLLPAAGFALLLRREGAAAENLLLPLMSLSLFYVLFGMVNPGYLPFAQADAGFRRAMAGGLVYAELAVFLLLRLLRCAACADRGLLRRYVRGMLLTLAAVLIYSACVSSVQSLLADFRALEQANTDGAPLFPTKLFLTLRMLQSAVPCMLDVLVIFAALRLLDARQAGEAGEADRLAGVLSARCRHVLSAALLGSLGVYLLQLLCARWLRQISFELSLPLYSIALCLAAMLLARLLQENRRLREDNDLFI